MPPGGKRPNAGRKKGSVSRKTKVNQAIVEKAAASGVTPLDVMLKAMREHYEAKRWDDAAAIAKDAAPYIHPRLAAIAHTGKDGKDLFPSPKVLSREEFNALSDEERLLYLRGQLVFEIADKEAAHE